MPAGNGWWCCCQPAWDCGCEEPCNGKRHWDGDGYGFDLPGQFFNNDGDFTICWWGDWHCYSCQWCWEGGQTNRYYWFFVPHHRCGGTVDGFVYFYAFKNQVPDPVVYNFGILKGDCNFPIDTANTTWTVSQSDPPCPRNPCYSAGDPQLATCNFIALQFDRTNKDTLVYHNGEFIGTNYSPGATPGTGTDHYMQRKADSDGAPVNRYAHEDCIVDLRSYHRVLEDYELDEIWGESPDQGCYGMGPTDYWDRWCFDYRDDPDSPAYDYQGENGNWILGNASAP